MAVGAELVAQVQDGRTACRRPHGVPVRFRPERAGPLDRFEKQLQRLAAEGRVVVLWLPTPRRTAAAAAAPALHTTASFQSKSSSVRAAASQARSPSLTNCSRMAQSRRPATVVRSQLERIVSTSSAGSDFGSSDKRQSITGRTAVARSAGISLRWYRRSSGQLDYSESSVPR